MDVAWVSWNPVLGTNDLEVANSVSMNCNRRWNFAIAFLSSHNFILQKVFYLSWETLWRAHLLWLAAPGFNLNWHSPEFRFGLQMEGLARSFLSRQDWEDTISLHLFYFRLLSRILLFLETWQEEESMMLPPGSWFLHFFVSGSVKVSKHWVTGPESWMRLSNKSCLFSNLCSMAIQKKAHQIPGILVQG